VNGQMFSNNIKGLIYLLFSPKAHFHPMAINTFSHHNAALALTARNSELTF